MKSSKTFEITWSAAFVFEVQSAAQRVVLKIIDVSHIPLELLGTTDGTKRMPKQILHTNSCLTVEDS